MINIQILKVNKKGESLEGKIFLFDKFDQDKFDVLLTYFTKHYKNITPAFVFCLELPPEDVIQVLRELINGQPYPLYCIGEGVYFFRCGNLIFFVEEEG